MFSKTKPANSRHYQQPKNDPMKYGGQHNKNYVTSQAGDVVSVIWRKNVTWSRIGDLTQNREFVWCSYGKKKCDVIYRRIMVVISTCR